MLHTRIKEDELISLWLKWIILKLTAVAIKTHQLTCLSKDRSKLVHDSAVTADILMLCSLTGQHHVPFADLIVCKEVIEGTSEATLHSSRRTHTCSERHISCKCDIETFDINAEKAEFLHHSVYEACPSSIRSFWIIDLKFHTVLEVDGISHNGISAIRTHFCHYAAIHCAWEYEAAIIVCMFSNKIYTAWRMIYITSLAVKMLDKATSYKFYIHYCMFL